MCTIEHAAKSPIVKCLQYTFSIYRCFCTPKRVCTVTHSVLQDAVQIYILGAIGHARSLSSLRQSYSNEIP